MPLRVCHLEHGVGFESLDQFYMTQTVPSTPTCIIFIRISDRLDNFRVRTGSGVKEVDLAATQQRTRGTI